MSFDKGVVERIKSWRHSPLTFVKECIDVKPSEQQIEGLLTFGKPGIKRMTVRSGHGTGKDAFAAWIILWFLSTRPYSKVACTAPTARQLNDVLWSEIAKWFRQSRLQEEFVHQKDKFFHRSAPKEWWARAISPQVRGTKEDQAETLAGLHGDHLLIVVDEASGVPDPVFVPLEGAMTQEDNKVLLIGNMTKNMGYFYDTHFHSGITKRWDCLHWDSRKSSLVSEDMISYFRDKYGEDSNVFSIRVKGDPPLEDEQTVIPLAWARQCLGNEVEVADDEPIYLGVDVARYGSDKSVVLPRRGLRIDKWETFNGLNTISLGGFINQSYAELGASGLAIDEIGVGAGVTDWLHKHGHIKCFGVNVANRSSDPEKYARLRDELWWAVREKCMKGHYSFPEDREGEDLCNELASPYYDFNQMGAIVVEPKRKMKLRGVESPNIADALCLTEYFANMAHRVWGHKKEKPAREKLQSPARHGWMVA